MYPIFTILLLGLPLAEIAVLVIVGSRIGVLSTLGLIVLGALAGIAVLRMAGSGVIGQLNREIEQGHEPERMLVDRVMMMISGILLLIPGLLTDVPGLLLLIPAIRGLAWRHFSSRMYMTRSFSARFSAEDRFDRHEHTIDLGEDEYSTSNPDSPWRKRNID